MMTKYKHKFVGLFLSTLCVATFVPTANAEVESLFTDGKAKFNFRMRYEGVDQDGIAEEADALTLRSRFSWNSKAEQVWSLGLEADYVSVLGSEDFNSTENGKGQFPVVADPEGFDLNQAFVKYRTQNFTGTVGRQRILHNGQRFVGGVAWRQNEQTFDALRFETGIAAVKLDYSYVWNVNRIFGPDDGAQPADWEGNSHLLDALLYEGDGHKVKGFAYLLDFENANGPANSNETYGLAYSGKFDQLKVTASIATQSDYADNPADYSADYYELSLSYALPKVTVKAGVEVLGSDDGVASFNTPLATLHKFQGWADVFLVTPAAGIEDKYVGFNGSINKVKLALSYHQYDADEGSADYGSEINLVANYKIGKAWSVQAKYADYDAKDLATDRSKFWLTLAFQP